MARQQVMVRYWNWKKAHEDRSPVELADLLAPDYQWENTDGEVLDTKARLAQMLHWQRTEPYFQVRELHYPHITIDGGRVLLDIEQEQEGGSWIGTGTAHQMWEKRQGYWLLVREKFDYGSSRVKKATNSS